MPQIRATIAETYPALSEALRQAADFVAENTLDVATRSLRAVAADSGVSPATFSRLARALGYPSYAALRDQARAELGRREERFSAKARQLRLDAAQPGAQPLLMRQTAACLANIGALTAETELERLEEAADRLAEARKVVLVASLGSAGIADYFAYMTSWFAEGWTVAGRNGVTLASALARLSAEDVVVVISKAPYARRTVRAAKRAASHGATVIALTDSHAFPGAGDADYVFIQRAESPQFFSSYVASVALIETIVGMLVARAGPDAEARIQEIADENRRLEAFATD